MNTGDSIICISGRFAKKLAGITGTIDKRMDNSIVCHFPLMSKDKETGEATFKDVGFILAEDNCRMSAAEAMAA